MNLSALISSFWEGPLHDGPYLLVCSTLRVGVLVPQLELGLVNT